jgi:hypothetical protein
MRAVACLAIAFGLSACAGSTAHPGSGATPDPDAKLAEAQRTHEYPGPPVHQSAFGLPTPVEAIDVFATVYINWTADTVSNRMRALAKLSVGQARSTVLLAAAETAHDYELVHGGIANSGTVEAIAPLPDAGDQYVVVTRERTSASNTTAYQGLAPAWHVALATVSRVAPGTWVVSSWQPEN